MGCLEFHAVCSHSPKTLYPVYILPFVQTTCPSGGPAHAGQIMWPPGRTCAHWLQLVLGR